VKSRASSSLRVIVAAFKHSSWTCAQQQEALEMSTLSKRKGVETSRSNVCVEAKRSKSGEAGGNTNTEVGMKSPRVKDKATPHAHRVSKLKATPVVQIQKVPAAVVNLINTGGDESNIHHADSSATTSVGKSIKSEGQYHSMSFQAVAYALASLMALSWFDVPWTQHRYVVAAQAMGQSTFSPQVWAALSWLGEGIRAQLYLYGPSELALSESDPQPKLLLTHGAFGNFHFYCDLMIFACALIYERS